MEKPLFILGVAISLALCGCGDRAPEQPARTDTGASGSETAKNAEPAIGSGTVEAPREIKIEANDAMKFSATHLEAKAGETVRLRLVNTGSTPKEAMGHNWVLLRAGVDVSAYANAAVGAKETDYVPAARAADVIAHTKLLGGGQKDAVVFTVPADVPAGTELPFLCTFPAHFQLGMKGVLIVR